MLKMSIDRLISPLIPPSLRLCHSNEVLSPSSVASSAAPSILVRPVWISASSSSFFATAAADDTPLVWCKAWFEIDWDPEMALASCKALRFCHHQHQRSYFAAANSFVLFFIQKLNLSTFKFQYLKLPNFVAPSEELPSEFVKLRFIFVSHYYSHRLLWLFQFVSLSARDNMLPHFMVMGWQPQQWHHNRQLTFADTVQWAYILCSLPSSFQFGIWIQAVRASRGHDWGVQIFTAVLWAESTVWPRAQTKLGGPVQVFLSHQLRRNSIWQE